MQHLKALPIWRDANLLLVAVEQAVRRFDAGHPWPARFAQPLVAQICSRHICPRYHKYSLGNDLRHQAMHLCRLIHRAAAAPNDQADRLTELVLAVDDFKLTLQLGKELQAFKSFREFQALVELAVSVGRQSGGWRKRLHGREGARGARAGARAGGA